MLHAQSKWVLYLSECSKFTTAFMVLYANMLLTLSRTLSRYKGTSKTYLSKQCGVYSCTAAYTVVCLCVLFLPALYGKPPPSSFLQSSTVTYSMWRRWESRMAPQMHLSGFLNGYGLFSIKLNLFDNSKLRFLSPWIKELLIWCVSLIILMNLLSLSLPHPFTTHSEYS